VAFAVEHRTKWPSDARDAAGTSPASRHKSGRCYTLHGQISSLTYEVNDNLLYEVDNTQEALYGGAMADEPKNKPQRERALIDPVLKFLF